MRPVLQSAGGALLLAALSGCTVVLAAPGTIAAVERLGNARPEVYSDLSNVPGTFVVVGDVQVENRGRPLQAIEAELFALAKRQGADAIVLHPFNRRPLSVAYAIDDHEHDPLLSSRATGIRMTR